jgi:hypothetical protein
MPRKPAHMNDEEEIQRLIPIKGWVYNLFADRGKRQKRSTKHQIAFELEQLAERLRDQEATQVVEDRKESTLVRDKE